MRNLLYKQNGKRNWLVAVVMAGSMAVGGTVACTSSHRTASVACADTAEMAFTLSTGSHGSTSGSSGSSGKKTTSGGTGTSTTNGGTNANGGTNTNGGTTGSRYGSNGGTNGGTTSAPTSSSNRYGSNGGTNTGATAGTGNTFNKNAKTGLSGTVKMPSTIPAPPKGTTRVTVPGEKAYTPPSNKVAQPKYDVQAAQASVQNRRFLMSSGSHFRSPVTKHVYYYHPASYYTNSVYQDLYNPYDGRNYRSSGYGTYYGQFSPYWYLVWATMLVGSC